MAAGKREQWRPVVGFEGLYQVSDRGRVRSFHRDPEGELLNPMLNRGGYPYVSLYRDGEQYTRTVHRTVLEAWRGPRPEGHHAAHWDGNKTNNRVSNLRWATPADNVADQVRHGVHREARKTACPRGHKYSGSNLRITFDGRRACRACHREYARRRRAELADA